MVLRYTAFSTDPAGGNPAGIVLDARGMDDHEMLATAADLGFSESVFLFPLGGREYDVRYFSPLAEVPFCGHATIAAGVTIAERMGPGELSFNTLGGPIGVETRAGTATLTSAPGHVSDVPGSDLERFLLALDWPAGDLDPDLPPRIAFAGAHHLVLAARMRARLSRLDYDFDRLAELMRAHDLTTVHLVWRESELLFHARDPFPVGGKFEDPATGAAAAAFGAYLRELGVLRPPARFTILQGQDMGRPSELVVDLEEGVAEVRVTGAAVSLV